MPRIFLLILAMVAVCETAKAQNSTAEPSMCTADQMKICSGCASSVPYCCVSGAATRGCSKNASTWNSSACKAQCKLAPKSEKPATPVMPVVNVPVKPMVPVVTPVTPVAPEPSKPVASGDGSFPADGETLSIQYKNSTGIPVIVWLDNQAFCPRTSDKADCKQGDDAAWDRNLGKFFIYTKKDGQWMATPGKSGRKQEILPGQVWRITPPVNEKKMPYWCFDQPAGGDKWVRNCPGVGSWVTTANVNMKAIEKVTRFEYNINRPRDPNGAHEIWFNQSAVDGSNINATTEYTGNCPDNKRTCQLDLQNCPYKAKADGALTCFSPKFWPDLAKCGTNDFGKQWNMSPRDLAGCGYAQRERKAECHKWWATNSCAQSWLKYLQDGAKCQTYGWAYDEMRWDPSQGDNFDKNGNPAHNKVVRPLINCPIKPGTSLNIDITDILR